MTCALFPLSHLEPQAVAEAAQRVLGGRVGREARGAHEAPWREKRKSEKVFFFGGGVAFFLVVFFPLAAAGKVFVCSEK